MSSVPKRPPIDRSVPPFRDDPVIARLTDEQAWALADIMARFARSLAGRIVESGLTVEEYFDRAEQQRVEGKR